MTRLLPPLNAIRVFEAAARHLSFKAAAAELGVTNGAVSLQVKNLEDALGARLFERSARSVTLTGDGQRYFRAVRTALRILKDATAEFRAVGKGVVTVSCTPMFASQCLVPRLSAFQRVAPTIDVRISTTNRLIDFARDGIDLAVRHGLGRYPGLLSEKLLDDDMIVACSPELLKAKPRLRDAADLRQFAFLHDKDETDWRLWLVSAGVPDVDWPAGPAFTDARDLIEAAVAGQGMALVRASMIRNELLEGRLVQPLPAKLKIDFAYFLVYPPGALDRQDCAIFRNWLVDEAGVGFTGRVRARR